MKTLVPDMVLMENLYDECLTEIEAKGAAEAERRIDAVDPGELRDDVVEGGKRPIGMV